MAAKCSKTSPQETDFIPVSLAMDSWSLKGTTLNTWKEPWQRIKL